MTTHSWYGTGTTFNFLFVFFLWFEFWICHNKTQYYKFRTNVWHFICRTIFARKIRSGQRLRRLMMTINDWMRVLVSYTSVLQHNIPYSIFHTGTVYLKYESILLLLLVPCHFVALSASAISEDLRKMIDYWLIDSFIHSFRQSL